MTGTVQVAAKPSEPPAVTITANPSTHHAAISNGPPSPLSDPASSPFSDSTHKPPSPLGDNDGSLEVGEADTGIAHAPTSHPIDLTVNEHPIFHRSPELAALVDAGKQLPLPMSDKLFAEVIALQDEAVAEDNRHLLCQDAVTPEDVAHARDAALAAPSKYDPERLARWSLQVILMHHYHHLQLLPKGLHQLIGGLIVNSRAWDDKAQIDELFTYVRHVKTTVEAILPLKDRLAQLESDQLNNTRKHDRHDRVADDLQRVKERLDSAASSDNVNCLDKRLTTAHTEVVGRLERIEADQVKLESAKADNVKLECVQAEHVAVKEALATVKEQLDAVKEELQTQRDQHSADLKKKEDDMKKKDVEHAAQLSCLRTELRDELLQAVAERYALKTDMAEQRASLESNIEVKLAGLMTEFGHQHDQLETKLAEQKASLEAVKTGFVDKTEFNGCLSALQAEVGQHHGDFQKHLEEFKNHRKTFSGTATETITLRNELKELKRVTGGGQGKERLDERIDKMDERLGETNQRLDTTITRVNETTERVDGTVARVDETKYRVDETVAQDDRSAASHKLENLSRCIDELKDNIGGLAARITTIEGKADAELELKEFKALKAVVDDVQVKIDHVAVKVDAKADTRAEGDSINAEFETFKATIDQVMIDMANNDVKARVDNLERTIGILSDSNENHTRRLVHVETLNGAIVPQVRVLMEEYESAEARFAKRRRESTGLEGSIPVVSNWGTPATALRRHTGDGYMFPSGPSASSIDTYPPPPSASSLGWRELTVPPSSSSMAIDSLIHSTPHPASAVSKPGAIDKPKNKKRRPNADVAAMDSYPEPSGSSSNREPPRSTSQWATDTPALPNDDSASSRPRRSTRGASAQAQAGAWATPSAPSPSRPVPRAPTPTSSDMARTPSADAAPPALPGPIVPPTQAPAPASSALNPINPFPLATAPPGPVLFPVSMSRSDGRQVTVKTRGEISKMTKADLKIFAVFLGVSPEGNAAAVRETVRDEVKRRDAERDDDNDEHGDVGE